MVNPPHTHDYSESEERIERNQGGEWLLECEDCVKDRDSDGQPTAWKQNRLNNESSALALKRAHESKRPTHDPEVRYVGNGPLDDDDAILPDGPEAEL